MSAMRSLARTVARNQSYKKCHTTDMFQYFFTKIWREKGIRRAELTDRLRNGGGDSMEIKRPNTPQDGPADGVMGVVECIRTDFLENPAEGEAAFQQREKSQAHITASVEIGTFGIRDMATGVMLTVSLKDAMEIMKEAIDASKKE